MFAKIYEEKKSSLILIKLLEMLDDEEFINKFNEELLIPYFRKGIPSVFKTFKKFYSNESFCIFFYFKYFLYFS